jgi:hypothetical protein
LDQLIPDSDASIVKFVRIKFASREQESKAFHGLILRGRVISLRDDEFIIPVQGLEWLATQNLTPNILAWLNQDDVSRPDPAGPTGRSILAQASGLGNLPRCPAA